MNEDPSKFHNFDPITTFRNLSNVDIQKLERDPLLLINRKDNSIYPHPVVER